MKFDGKAFGQEVVGVVKEYVSSALQPLTSRLDALEKSITNIPAIVSEAMSAIPAPQDGKSVTVDDVAPLIAAEVEKRVSELPRPKDGLDVKDMFRADGGRLIAVMSDGTTKDLGVFVGKDGEPGKDGRDGFSLSDFDATMMDDGRTVLLSFDRGEQSFKVELAFPVMIYRGMFKEGRSYQKGDTVTWGGSLWHCDADTDEKPDGPQKHWTLAAKRGRDGKDAVVKAKNGSPLVRVR